MFIIIAILLFIIVLIMLFGSERVKWWLSDIFDIMKVIFALGIVLIGILVIFNK